MTIIKLIKDSPTDGSDPLVDDSSFLSFYSKQSWLDFRRIQSGARKQFAPDFTPGDPLPEISALKQIQPHYRECF